MDEKTALELARSRLSEKRFQHTVNVRDMAVALALRYGADPHKAAIAALLHDTAKEMSPQELLQIFQDNAIIADNAQNRPQPVWHGIAAAILAQTQWGVEDEEILDAIRCHTTGRRGMTLLDKILYMADMTSAERTYPEAAVLRRLQMEDLDKALAQALEMSLAWLKERGKVIDPITRQACEEYHCFVGGKSFT